MTRRLAYFGIGGKNRFYGGGVAGRPRRRLCTLDGRDAEFRSAENDLAHDQFPPQKWQELALDPKVPSFQNREIDRRILDAHILKVEAIPGCEGDSKN